MKTKADLRRLTLAHLKVIAAVTSAPSATQDTLCDLYIDGARGLLLEVGLCWWDEDSIPEAVIIPLSRFVASQACAAFGKNAKGYEEQEYPARKQIAALKSSGDRETVRQDYF